jgi:hypothetical protein
VVWLAQRCRFDSEEFRATLAKTLGVPEDDLRILSVEAGSVVVEMVVSTAAAEALQETPLEVRGLVELLF